MILSFAAASLFLPTAAGFLWDKVFARTTDAAESAALATKADPEPPPPYGLKRMLAVFVPAAKELAGATWSSTRSG